MEQLVALGDDAITVVRALLVEDSFGNESRDWPNATRAPVEGCSVQWSTTIEVVDGREVTVARRPLFAPAGTDLVYTDRVEFGGESYEVDGKPQTWPNHVYAILKSADSS